MIAYITNIKYNYMKHVNMTITIPVELREEIKSTKDINWSEVYVRFTLTFWMKPERDKRKFFISESSMSEYIKWTRKVPPQGEN